MTDNFCRHFCPFDKWLSHEEACLSMNQAHLI